MPQKAKAVPLAVPKAKAVQGRPPDTATSWWQQQQTDQPLPELMASDQPEALIAWLRQRQGTAVVLASGDPLWFGIGRRLLEACSADQLHFHPAPSSLQLAFARLGRPWQDAAWISLHGRDPAPLAQKLQPY